MALHLPCFAVKTWMELMPVTAPSATHLLPHLLLVLPDGEKPF